MKMYDAIKAINKTPVFNNIKPQANKNRMRPKKSTLLLALTTIRQHKSIRRIDIVKETDLSGHAVDRCIDALLDDELIKRIKIGRAGNYDIYSYSAVKLV